MERTGLTVAPKAAAVSPAAATPGYTAGELENTMTSLDTPDQVKQYLTDLGFTELSTGGGYSAMFLERDVDAGRWRIMLTDWETDTAALGPGRPFGIALYGPMGEWKEELFEVHPEIAKLPDALAHFTREGEVRFGKGSKGQ